MILAAVVALMGDAHPAAAHGTAGQAPVDYETRVESIEPTDGAMIDGIRARTTDLGEHVEVTSSRREIIVLGYNGEPYLRVGPDGVWRNERSPATFLNRSVVADDPVPAEFDPNAAPDWARISASSTARWHDHRLHPAGRGPLTNWRVTFTVNGRRAAIVGTTTLLSPPATLSAIALVVGFALTAWLALRRGSRTGFAVTSTALVAGAAALTIARWTASTEPMRTRIAVAWPIVLVVLVVIACFRVRRGIEEASPWFVFGFAAIAIAFGFALLPWLTHAQVPATGPTLAWRVVVAGALGAGSTGVVCAARRLRIRNADGSASQTESEASAAIRRSR